MLGHLEGLLNAAVLLDGDVGRQAALQPAAAPVVAGGLRELLQAINRFEIMRLPSPAPKFLSQIL
ncbi:hypothetical protein C2W62_21845 [Candidatus Entotheonella serta]|nr:hypothetical protein C2W62_21845 [Candidatus Entotheonella serta]